VASSSSAQPTASTAAPTNTAIHRLVRTSIPPVGCEAVVPESSSLALSCQF
jgi:hypothetical protein